MTFYQKFITNLNSCGNQLMIARIVIGTALILIEIQNSFKFFSHYFKFLEIKFLNKRIDEIKNNNKNEKI